jgi:cell division transport system ATP-binding protein
MIEFTNVSKTYDTGNRAVRNINLRIRDGEFVFLTGRSGSGKSTLIKLITRELKPTEGRIRVNGYDLGTLRQRDIPRFRRSLGVVFQDFRLLNDRNVFENIAFAQRVIGASPREIRENVPEMLQLTGLSAKYKNMPFQLSGGEQQRVAIARAILNEPELILADEPTGNLDAETADGIMSLLYDINKIRGTAVVIVTHNLSIIEKYPGRVFVCKDEHCTENNASKA